jgi:transposase
MDLRTFGTILSGNRRPNGEFTEAARAGIVAAAICGISHTEIAEHFKTKRRQTITFIISTATKAKTTKSAYRKGAPRKLNARAKRHIIVLARRNPHFT